MDKQILIEQLLDAYKGDVVSLSRDIRAASMRLVSQAVKLSKKDRLVTPVIVELRDLSKSYKLGATTINALDAVSLKIHEGEIVAILGKSGSGKSTLLHMIGGLDRPTSGSVIVDGVDITKLRDSRLSKYRGQKIGFVFQSFYLQPFLTVGGNIEVPAMFARTKVRERRERAKAVIAGVGLEERENSYGKELSGGQIQRVAIARALINTPRIVLADEPTGNLDQQNADMVFGLFQKARDAFGATVVLVTHDEELAQRADRIIRVQDGKVNQ